MGLAKTTIINCRNCKRDVLIPCKNGKPIKDICWDCWKIKCCFCDKNCFKKITINDNELRCCEKCLEILKGEL